MGIKPGPVLDQERVVALPHPRPQVPPGQSPRASPGWSEPSPQSLPSSPAPGAAPGAETLTAIGVGVGWSSLMSPCPQGHHGGCVACILAAQGMLGGVQGVSSSMGCVLEQSLLQQSHCEVQDGAPQAHQTFPQGSRSFCGDKAPLADREPSSAAQGPCG